MSVLNFNTSTHRHCNTHFNVQSCSSDDQMSRGCCSISASSGNCRLWCVTFAKASSSVACTQHKLNANAITTPIIRFISFFTFKYVRYKMTPLMRAVKKTYENKHTIFTYRSHRTRIIERYNQNVSFTITFLFSMRYQRLIYRIFDQCTRAIIHLLLYSFNSQLPRSEWTNHSTRPERHTDKYSDVEKVKVFLFKSKMSVRRTRYVGYYQIIY